jgi:hypothetical protein
LMNSLGEYKRPEAYSLNNPGDVYFGSNHLVYNKARGK